MRFDSTRERWGADLWRRIEVALAASDEPVLARKALGFVELNAREARGLLDYAHAFIPEHASARADTFAWDAARTVPLKVTETELLQPLFEILTAPIDLHSARGQARQALRNALGLFGQVDQRVLDGLAARYGSEHLKGASVVYNGHTTVAAASFFPTLMALGLEEGAYRRSSYSGDGGITSLINTQLATRITDLGADPGARLLSQLATSTHLPVIVANGGPLLVGRTLPEVVKERIARGDIRFILHNAADIEAMRGLGVEAVVIDVAHSLAKQLEARVIGEQLAVHGAAALRDHEGARAHEATIIVKGHGLIGAAVAEAYVRFGADPSRIVIVDTSETVRASALANGFTRVHATMPDLSKEAHGIVIEATNGVGLTGNDLDLLPRATVGLTATSGGKGIDIASMQTWDRDFTATRQHFAALGVGIRAENVFADIRLRQHATARYLTLVNCRDEAGGWRAYPKNLARPVGQQRLVTSAMLAMAVCYATTVTTPGMHALPSSHGEMLLEAMPQLKSNVPVIADLLEGDMATAAAAIRAA